MPVASEDPISQDAIRECLERSGYLMESRLVRVLAAADFFVEPNVAHKDPRTGKAREIDLTAESARGIFHPGTCVKTTLVIEAVNNRYPVVLLTERPSTPNADFESYVKYACSPRPNPFVHLLDLYERKSANWDNLFSQYCALSKKSGKDDLMASHPEDMYTSLLKLSEFAEAQVADFYDWISQEEGEYWRLFFWQPMLVVSGQLLTARLSSDGSLLLKETPMARLEFNWHDAESRKTTVIEVLREDFVMERIEAIRTQDECIERVVSEARSKTSGKR